MKNFILILILILGLNTYSQNTIGIIQNTANSYDGYTLFTPITSTETYLINNCGQVVHKWSSTLLPGASVYLLENGNLLRTGKISNSVFLFGGVGGKIELFDWDGNLLWSFTYSSTTETQHHDIFPLPNGNILMLAATVMTSAEMIQAGRDPSQIDDGLVYNEQILELQPVGIDGANIVWQWDIKDHFIQDFDATKDNFGNVSDSQQLLDINYLNSTKANANWLHVNSIQYNAVLDQIVLSTRILNEIYIIDHSTTTAEAASHSGGTYGKGGDFLYRWGNLEAYRHGAVSDLTLFGQHYPHWIPSGLTDAGKIMIFNNGKSRTYSSIDIITPPISSPGVYLYNTSTGYGPTVAEWTYSDTSTLPSSFFSTILSSGQRLPNGNTLICDGDSGHFFEIDSNKNIVWDYINPDTTNGISTQGDTPAANLVFRALKFSKSFPAFTGKDLTPGNPIELNPNIGFCTTLSTNKFDISEQLQIFPNPISNIININTSLAIDKIEIYDLFGKLIKTKVKSKQINVENLAQGMYFAKIYSENKLGTKKFIKL